MQAAALTAGAHPDRRAGATSLYSGARVRKSDALVGALGDCDELTSTIGVAIEFCKASPADLGGLVARLVGIQCQVQQVNSLLATPSKLASGSADLDAFTEALEEAIDEMDAALPPLQEFILPVRVAMLAAIGAQTDGATTDRRPSL